MCDLTVFECISATTGEGYRYCAGDSNIIKHYGKYIKLGSKAYVTVHKLSWESCKWCALVHKICYNLFDYPVSIYASCFVSYQ